MRSTTFIIAPKFNGLSCLLIFQTSRLGEDDIWRDTDTSWSTVMDTVERSVLEESKANQEHSLEEYPDVEHRPIPGMSSAAFFPDYASNILMYTSRDYRLYEGHPSPQGPILPRPLSSNMDHFRDGHRHHLRPLHPLNGPRPSERSIRWRQLAHRFVPRSLSLPETSTNIISLQQSASS